MVTMVACEWICESALLMLDTNWSVTFWLDTKFNALYADRVGYETVENEDDARKE